MGVHSLSCHSCGKALDERELVSTSVTIDKCPKCGETIRKAEGFARANFAAIVVGEVAAIDTWLDNYASDMSCRIVKRNTGNNLELCWVVGTPHSFAIECVYHEMQTGIVAIRAATQNSADSVLKETEKLASIAAQCGIQPYATRQDSWGISERASTNAVWGMVQYVSISTLSTMLLTTVANRLNNAMHTAKSEILGDPDV